jgi:hypothetical protein
MTLSYIPSPWAPPTLCPSSLNADWDDSRLTRYGTFATSVDASGIVLTNDRVAVAFASQDAGAGLVRLRDLVAGRDYLRPGSHLWELEIRKPDGFTVSVDNVGKRAVVAVQPAEDRLDARFLWSAIAVEDIGELDVTAHVRLDADSSAIRLNLAVEYRFDGARLWRVDFPVADGFGFPGECDFAYSSLNHGKLLRGFGGALRRTYPSGSWSMQYVSLTCGGGTLYAACEDPNASFKGFRYDAGVFRFYAVPSEAIDEESEPRRYELPYDVVLEPIEGDWYDASLRYREWALRQRWTSRGTIRERTDTREDFKDVALWMLENGSSDEVVPKVLRAKAFFGVPTGVHWYNWHVIAFDHEYPHYFPTKPGFADGVRRLKEAGVFAMPYINARLWDNTLEDFAQALPAASKNPDGKHYTEIYGSSAPLSPMCPTQPYWHDVVERIVRTLKDEYGINALYMDQIASAVPQRCFDSTHGHPLGGGSWWVEGYDAMMTRIRALTGHEVALTTENNCECYAHWFDAYLIWTDRLPEMCPVYPAVYGDRILRFASPASTQDDDTAFAVKVGRDFLWGAQLGWMGSWLLEPTYVEKATFLRRCVRMRAHPDVRESLVFGTMERAPRWVRPVPRVACRWHRGGDRIVDVELDALERATWRAHDGSVTVFVANFDGQPHAVSLDLSPWAHGRRPTPVGETLVPIEFDGNRVELTVPGRDVVALRVPV